MSAVLRQEACGGRDIARVQVDVHFDMNQNHENATS